MSNISYESENNNNNISVGKFLYISESTFANDWNSYPHKHFCTEIFCINKGSGSFKVSRNVFQVEAGDIIIINPNLHHTEFSSNKNPLNYYVLGIEDLGFVFENSSSDFPVIKNPLVFNNVQFLLTNMIVEMRKKEINYQNICNKFSDILVILLMRQKKIHSTFKPTKDISRESINAKEYIDNNYHLALTLDSLAQHCLLSKFYLSRKFSKEFGISPIEYLTEKRLQVAENLLVYTNFTMTQIAQSIGYTSQSYFSQVYRKYKNVSPSEYRAMHIAS